MKRHYLKTWPVPFEAIKAKKKTAEFRPNDRDFVEGDSLVLQKWNPETGAYEGEEILLFVTHVLKNAFGVPPGFAVLSFRFITAYEIGKDSISNFKY